MNTNGITKRAQIDARGRKPATGAWAFRAPLLWSAFICWIAFSTFTRAEAFEFKVKHHHVRGGCRGKLIIDDAQIKYVPDKGKHSQQWTFIDIQRLDVSLKKIELQSFQSQPKWKLGTDKVYEFTLLEGELTYAHQEFLRSKLSRPMVARLVESDSSPIQKIPVRHRHTLGGCEGVLSIYQDRIVYSTDHAGHSREWRYSDLETVGSPDHYHLRVTSHNETFTFDLKIPLEQKAYDSLWDRVNGLARPPATPEVK